MHSLISMLKLTEWKSRQWECKCRVNRKFTAGLMQQATH